jgi:lysozyme
MNFKLSKVKGGILASAMLCSTIGINEGYKNIAYLDSVGVPTICYGHTGGISLGTKLTDDECQVLFNKDIKWAVEAFERNVKVEVGQHTAIAMIDFIFNVGESNFKQSTMLKKLNSGDIVGACNEFPKWVYAKGIKLKGLENRRKESRKLCLQF